MMSFVADRARKATLFAWRCVVVALLLAALPAAAVKAQSPQIRIAFVGDSMSDGIWGGIIRKVSTDGCLRGKFDLGRFGNNGTGLTRPDKYNWPEEVKKISATFHPDLLVVSLGLNDRQFIVDLNAGRQHIEYGTSEWVSKYTEQVVEFLQNGSTARAGLLWIGIPVMRDQVANNDGLQKNQIYSDAIGRFGDSKVHYVAPWKLNLDGDEVFKSIGPGPDGSIVTLRAPDGIHFTSAGYDLLASYIYPKIVENLKDHQIEAPQSCGR